MSVNKEEKMIQTHLAGLAAAIHSNMSRNCAPVGPGCNYNSLDEHFRLLIGTGGSIPTLVELLKNMSPNEPLSSDTNYIDILTQYNELLQYAMGAPRHDLQPLTPSSTIYESKLHEWLMLDSWDQRRQFIARLFIE